MVWFKTLFTDVFHPLGVFVLVVISLPFILLYALYEAFLRRGERNGEADRVDEREL